MRSIAIVGFSFSGRFHATHRGNDTIFPLHKLIVVIDVAINAFEHPGRTTSLQTLIKLDRALTEIRILTITESEDREIDSF